MSLSLYRKILLGSDFFQGIMENMAWWQICSCTIYFSSFSSSQVQNLKTASFSSMCSKFRMQAVMCVGALKQILHSGFKSQAYAVFTHIEHKLIQIDKWHRYLSKLAVSLILLIAINSWKAVLIQLHIAAALAPSPSVYTCVSVVFSVTSESVPVIRI